MSLCLYKFSRQQSTAFEDMLNYKILTQFSPNLGILLHASLKPTWLCQMWISDCKCIYIHRSNSCFNIYVSFILPQDPFSILYQALPSHSSLEKSRWLVPGVVTYGGKGKNFSSLPNKEPNKQPTSFMLLHPKVSVPALALAVWAHHRFLNTPQLKYFGLWTLFLSAMVCFVKWQWASQSAEETITDCWCPDAGSKPQEGKQECQESWHAINDLAK